MPFNKVGTKGITDGSIATAEFADGIVTSAKLQNSAVTNDKLTNTTVSVSGTSVSLGASTSIPNKFVNWQSVIVADGSTGTTGVSGRGYFINTTSAAHTFTLPVSATRGDNISIKDYAGTFATNNLTIARNGHNIQGVANNSLITTNRASVVLVYIDVTRGWEFVEESNVADLQEIKFVTATGGTITTDGDFKVHSFTGDGNFVVSCAGNPVGSDSVDYLVVAGGGGGGMDNGGGGGAGGYRTSFPGGTKITTPATTYPVTVGAGGVGAAWPAGASPLSTRGSPSIFSTITSTGGGGGGRNTEGGGSEIGQPGGSGGGSRNDAPGTGSGNTPPVSPPQGNPGGNAGTAPAYGSGGGGGAGAAGTAGTPSTGGPGGVGLPNSITGSPVFYAGGGGGVTEPGNPNGSGGNGGGGAGVSGPGATSNPGTANTGGGGGGSGGEPGSSPGGAGGKGIVIIRYKFQ
jgi:hypothetical protein